MSDIEELSLSLCDSYKAVFGVGAPMCFHKQELGKEDKYEPCPKIFLNSTSENYHIPHSLYLSSILSRMISLFAKNDSKVGMKFS